MAFLIGGANSLTGGYDIDNSLRFNKDSSPSLAYTPSSAGNRRTFTLSVWFKLVVNAGERVLLSADDAGGTGDNTNFDYIAINNDNKIFVYGYEGSENQQLKSTQVLRDPLAWYHLVVAFDTTQGTAANRVKIYLNGSQVTVFDTANYPDENFQTRFNNTNPHKISRYPDQAASYFDGYMAEYHLIDGSAKAPTDFGEVNDNGVWIPKAYTGTYGTNGFYLEFKQGTGILGDTTGRHLVTPTNGATYNTSIKKFGSSSLYLDNTNNYLNITNNLADFGFGSAGSNSWTVEFWAYYLGNSSSGSDMIVDFDTPTLRVNYRPADPQFKVNVGGTEYAFGNNSPSLADDTWTHIAVVNESGTLKIYKDGTVDSTTHDVSGKTVASPSYGYIGYFDADTFDGYIDELRISDIARYTGNFSVQTSVFTSDANTKLLLHMDDNKSFGADTSGQNNHLIPNNLNLLDSTTDTPTNNFATLNPLQASLPTNATYQGLFKGNLGSWTSSNDNSVDYRQWSSIAIPHNEKWYVETKWTRNERDHTKGRIGILAYHDDVTHGVLLDGDFGKIVDNSSSSYATGSMAYNEIFGCLYDLGNNQVTFYENGTSLGAISWTPNANYTYYHVVFSDPSGPQSLEFLCNFGNPAHLISSGNADPNGYGNFEYSTNSGYSLCTKNLAEYG